MSGKTDIEWATDVWNPTKGCDRVSAGCDNCYALTMAKRLKGMGQAAYQLDGDPRTSGPGFLAHEWPASLSWPLTVRKPMRVFVNSMSDLFHANISDEFIAEVFAVMALAPQHTFQVLTKRHARMRTLLNREDFTDRIADAVLDLSEDGLPWAPLELRERWWPLPNVWLGVSVENQHWADIRIPALLDTPAAVRFLSCEPLLGLVTISGAWRAKSKMRAERDYPYHQTTCDAGQGGCYHPPCSCDCHSYAHARPGIDWVIVGGESGPKARPMHPDWARSLRDQCQSAGIPFMFKQWGEWAPTEVTIGIATDRTPCMLADGWGDVVPPRTIGTQETHLWRVGKKAAGRDLDGRTWDKYPIAGSEVVGLGLAESRDRQFGGRGHEDEGDSPTVEVDLEPSAGPGFHDPLDLSHERDRSLRVDERERGAGVVGEVGHAAECGP